MVRVFFCFQCSKRAKGNRRPIPECLRTQAQDQLGRPLHRGDVICSACSRRRYQRHNKQLELLKSRPLEVVSESMSTSDASISGAPSLGVSTSGAPSLNVSTSCASIQGTSGPGTSTKCAFVSGASVNRRSVKAFYCFQCSKRAKGRKLIPESLRTQAAEQLGRPLHRRDVICNACRSRNYRPKRLELLKSRQIVSESAPASCTSTSGVPSSEYRWECVICKRTPGARVPQVYVPYTAIAQAFFLKRVFIQADSRCCKAHIDNNYFKTRSLRNLKSTHEPEQLSETEVSDLLQELEDNKEFLKASPNVKFENPSELGDKAYINLTGLSKEQFCFVTSFLHSMRGNAARSIRASLGVFLFKLRTGLPNSTLSTLFGLTTSEVQSIVGSVRRSLMKYFIPLNLGLGFQHTSQSDVSANITTPIAHVLFTCSSHEQSHR